MTALSSPLLEFILGLLSNDEELKQFDKNPEAFMADAGYGGCENEVNDYRNMVEDYKPQSNAVSDRSASAKADNGQADYQVVKHVTEKNDEVTNHHDEVTNHHDEVTNNHDYVTNNHDYVTNHHYGATTNHIDKSNWGDTYDVWAGKGSQVALNGGLNFGEDTEFEGDFDYDNEGFNHVHNSGDGSQVAGHDADADHSFNENGSGLQINDDTYVGEDLENNQASDGSVAGGGTIDNSSSDDDVTLQDNVLQVGENNVNESKGAIVDSGESATTGGEVDTIDDSLIVKDNEVEVEVEIENEGYLPL
jgi:hypothetical protein